MISHVKPVTPRTFVHLPLTEKKPQGIRLLLHLVLSPPKVSDCSSKDPTATANPRPLLKASQIKQRKTVLSKESCESAKIWLYVLSPVYDALRSPSSTLAHSSLVPDRPESTQQKTKKRCQGPQGRAKHGKTIRFHIGPSGLKLLSVAGGHHRHAPFFQSAQRRVCDRLRNRLNAAQNVSSVFD